MNVALARRVFLPALVLLVAAACARPVQIGSEPGPVYAIEVVNPLAQDMIVSYDDGNGERTLGTVGRGETERFIITAPASLRITIRARDAGGTRTAGPFTVQLAQGETPGVTLR